MAHQSEVKVHVHINSLYKAFDQSGSLPFSIIFGLCRRSPHDTANRNIILDTSGSIFDVPYALANGFLKLLEGKGPDKTEVDLSSFSAPPSSHRYVHLRPPNGQPLRLGKDFEVLHSEINAKSDLALLLKPNTHYTIRLASTNLEVQWWTYTDADSIPTDLDLTSRKISEVPKLINSKVTGVGNASFQTYESLPLPPDLETRLMLRNQPSATTRDNDCQSSTCLLEVSIANNNSDTPVSVQSSSLQRFLALWGPFQPRYPIDRRYRITSTSISTTSLGKQNLLIRSRKNGATIYQNKPPVSQGGGISTDNRPQRSDFTTLFPGKPLVQTINLTDLLIISLKLGDGEYLLELETEGAWWCWGTVDEIFKNSGEGDDKVDEKENEKIPQNMFEGPRPAIWLRSEDRIAVSIIDGKVVGR